MLDTPKIYSDPIISKRRLGNAFQPFEQIKESVTIEKHYALLTEIPNEYEKVKVTGRGVTLYESEDREITENTYRVDYVNGIVYFHEKFHNKTLTFEYLGEGVYLFPDSRVYLTRDKGFPNVSDKFFDVDRAILVQKNRVDEQIRSVPQPREVVDMRVDYNGKLFRVARDRIDAEQRKIEEAYYDAKGVRFNSLKERIDSLQLATEESFDEQGETNVNIWASIDLVPGKINLATGRLEKKIDGQIALLESQIRLVPEQIKLSVRRLEESVDGKFSKQESYIDMLSDRMELKVDVDGVTSAINLSKEGVRIDGRKVWITGQTKIDNAAIKSAHIQSLDANKITAGSIDTSRIRIHGGNSTEYLNLRGNTLESRGIVTSDWFGERSVRDVKFQLQDGYFRVRNDAEDKSLYFFDYGISSYYKGYNPDTDSAHGSGVIDFHSHMYHRGVRGLTLFSNRGHVAIQTLNRDIIFDAANNIDLRAKNGTIMFTGKSMRSDSIGVREPGTNFYIGVSGTRNGELRVTNKLYYQGANTTYYDVRARDFKGRRFIDTAGTSYIYMGSNLGVRITSKGTNRNNRITYRPIQASAFQVRSSRDSKTNIKKTIHKGLEAIRSLNVVDFNYIGDEQVNTGFIAEDSSIISNEDHDFIDLNKSVALLTLAVQELDKKLETL